MALLSSFNEDRPVTYFRGYPVYCATILTFAYAIGVLTTFLAKALGAWEAMIALFAFGYVKGHFTGLPPMRGAAQTTLIGGLAAGAAFGIARLIGR